MDYDEQEYYAQQQPQQVSENINYSEPLYSGTNTANASLTQWQLESNEILLEIENFLSSRIWSAKEECWLIEGEPILSKEGVRALMFSLRPRIDKTIFLTNLSDEDVKRMALDFRLWLAEFVFLNEVRYNIKKENFDNILYTLDQIYYAGVLKRSYLGGERNAISKSERRIERTIERPAQNKRSVFNFFK